MDLDVFVAEHRAEWARLDRLTHRRRRLSGEEVDELVRLYQRVATQLSALQAAGLDSALAGRLSGQIARSRAAVSGAQSSGWETVGRFFAISFPAAAYRARWWWLGSAVGSVLVAVIVGWRVAHYPALAASLVPRSAAANLVHHQFRHYYSAYDPQSFAAKVWTNNAVVAAETIMSGLLLGIPVIWVLYSNAVNGGVDGGLMASHGLSGEFWSLILPHGMLELSAVFLAAGVGMKMGWAVIDPGDRPRARALAEEGRSFVTAVLGLAVVLLVSGVIEAFVTPSSLPTWARIGIGGVAEAAFLAYVIILGRRAVAAGETGDLDQVPDEQPVAG